MMAPRGSTNRAVILQTIILVITLIGIAVSADRRVTVVEDTLKAETEMRKVSDRRIEMILEKLQANEQISIQNQAKVTTLLEMVQKRHDIIDAKKVR